MIEINGEKYGTIVEIGHELGLADSTLTVTRHRRRKDFEEMLTGKVGGREVYCLSTVAAWHAKNNRATFLATKSGRYDRSKLTKHKKPVKPRAKKKS